MASLFHQGVRVSSGLLLTLIIGPALVGAAEYEFTADPAQSVLTVKVEALGYEDQDSSAVSGSATATLTPASGLFTEIHITALALDLTDTIDLDIGPGGFLGGVRLTGTGLGQRLGGGFGAAGPPAPVDGAGNFAQTGNLVQGIGVFEYEGYGIFGGGLGSGSVDLSTQEPSPADFIGTVVDDGTTVTMTFPADFFEVFDFEGVQVSVWILGEMVLTAPTQTLLIGDLNCDGEVNFGDINAFVLALSDPAGYATLYPDCDILSGDINGDGVLDFGDIAPFVDLLS